MTTFAEMISTVADKARRDPSNAHTLTPLIAICGRAARRATRTMHGITYRGMDNVTDWADGNGGSINIEVTTVSQGNFLSITYVHMLKVNIVIGPLFHNGIFIENGDVLNAEDLDRVIAAAEAIISAPVQTPTEMIETAASALDHLIASGRMG